MGEIKQYVAGQVAPTKASGSAYINPNAAAPVEQAGRNLMNAAKGLGKLTEIYAEQERENLIMEESDKLNKSFIDLRAETEAQPASDQRKFFEERSQALKDDIEGRFDNRFVRNELIKSLNNLHNSELVRVNKRWRDNVVANTEAQLNNGTTGFLNNIENYWDDETSFNILRSEQVKHIQKAIDSGAVNPERGQLLIADFMDKTEKGRASMMLAKNPVMAVRELNKEGSFPGMSAATRGSLIERGEADLRAIEARRRAEEHQLKMERMARFRLMKDDAQTMGKAFSETGRKPAGWDKSLENIRANSDLDGGITFTQMHDIQMNQADLFEFKTKSAPDQITQIADLQKKADLGALNAREQLLLNDYRKINQDLQTAIHTGDYIGYVQKYQLRQINTLNVMDPASINERIKTLNVFEEATGGRYANEITDDEAGQIKTLYERSKREDRQAMASGLARLTNGSPETLLKKIGAKDPDVRTEITLLMSPNPFDHETADLMAAGREAIKNNKDAFNVGDLRNKIQDKLSETSIGLLDQNGKKLASITGAVSSLYAALNPEHKDKGVDNDTLDKALSRLGLGDMVKINGYSTPPFSRNMTARQMRQAHGVLDERIMTLGGGGYPVVQKPGGGTRRPTMKDIKTKGVLVPDSEGVYSLAFKDYATGEMFFAMNEDTGQRYRFNYALVRQEIAQAINSRNSKPVKLPDISGP